MGIISRDWSIFDTFCLGVCGKIGSGKSTLLNHLSKEGNFCTARYGDYFRSLAQTHELPFTRSTFQELTEKYLLKFGQFGLAELIVADANWDGKSHLLIDSIRFKETVGVLREIVAPSQFFLVNVEVSESIRLERISGRDGLSPQELAVQETHITERNLDLELAELADIHLPFDENVDEAASRIFHYIEKTSTLRGGF